MPSTLIQTVSGAHRYQIQTSGMFGSTRYVPSNSSFLGLARGESNGWVNLTELGLRWYVHLHDGSSGEK